MLRQLLYPLVIILYIIASLFPDPILSYAVGILANIALFVSLFHARGLYLYSGIIFYVIGIILFLNNDMPWHQFFLQFDSMLGILALFLMLPFLNSLILVGRYDYHLSNLLQYNVHSVGDLYQRGSIVTHILGLFLNIATIPLLLKSLHKSLTDYQTSFTNKLYTRNLLRAYALCLMWSPMEIMVIQTLELTKVNYLVILPLLLFFTIGILLLTMYLSKLKYQHLSITQTNSNVSLNHVFGKIKDLMVLLIILVAAVTLLDYVINQGYLFSLVLLIIPISLLWAKRIGKTKRYITHTISHWKDKTKGLANYFFMFLCAGFFVNVIAATKLLDVLQNMIIHFSQQTLILFIFIGVYFIITSYTGFHPLVSILLLGEILNPVMSAIAGIPLSIVLITCSLSTVMYSPFNVSISILASEIKVNLYRVGLWNLPFSIGLMTLSIGFAYMIHLIGLNL